jgi:ribosomal protein S12 methylthiotransferase
MKTEKTTASFISLGCFKNVVDTEVLGGLLEKKGIKIVSSYEKSDWLIVNTCGFIRDAKEESIDTILEALEKKENREVKYVAVVGCLPQRYYDDIKSNFKNADIIWGVNEPEKLAELILKTKKMDYKDKKPFLYNDTYNRILTTPPNTTFIKISEGCNMKCSFCIIPQIKGSFRSREIRSIMREAENYKKRGFQEINLISQNSTYFGKDKGEKSKLPELLKEISNIGFKWVRVLYLMPEEVDIEIIESFSNPTILPYFDLPFQHISLKILNKMNRTGGTEKNLELIKNIRKKFKNAIIRTTFIIGFPGETESDFNEIIEFAKKSSIERIGSFEFSEEENTSAFKLKKRVPPEIIKDRIETLMDISDRNIENYNKTLINSIQEFLPLGPCPWNNKSTIGRIKSQAPEIDGLTVVNKVFRDIYKTYNIKISGYENEILKGEKT